MDAEKVSTQPNLTKRLAKFVNPHKANPVKSRVQIIEETVNEAPLVEAKKEEDYSRFMPQ